MVLVTPGARELPELLAPGNTNDAIIKGLCSLHE